VLGTYSPVDTLCVACRRRTGPERDHGPGANPQRPRCEWGNISPLQLVYSLRAPLLHCRAVPALGGVLGDRISCEAICAEPSSG